MLISYIGIEILIKIHQIMSNYTLVSMIQYVRKFVVHLVKILDLILSHILIKLLIECFMPIIP